MGEMVSSETKVRQKLQQPMKKLKTTPT